MTKGEEEEGDELEAFFFMFTNFILFLLDGSGPSIPGHINK